MSITVMKQIKQCLQDKMYAHAEMYLDQAIAEAQEQEPVGSLSVRYHRGCKSMTNTDFDYNGDLPEGDYELYTSPPTQCHHCLQCPAAVGEDTPTAERSSRTTEWVGLTDEDYHWLLDNCKDDEDLIETTEAKLKAKNERLEKNT